MKTLFIILIASVVCPLASAQGPSVISYQGFLTDASQNPITGVYNVTFEFYPEGWTQGVNPPSEIISRTVSGVEVEKGVFSTTINVGGINFQDINYEVKVIVTGETESGRIPITSVPYALVAGSINASDIQGTISGAQIASGSVSSGMINGTIDIAHGGTGAANPSDARTNLGVQPLNAGLTSIAALSPSGGNMLYTTASNTYGATPITSIGINVVGATTQANARSAIAAQQSNANLDDLADGTLSDARLESTVDVTRLNTTGGVHVGGNSDPGTDNLVVDGRLGVKTTTTPVTTIEVVHGGGTPTAGDGLSITGDNGTNKVTWTLYTVPTNGNLLLYLGTTVKGIFNSSDGAYTSISDLRLKDDIEPLENILPNSMEIQTYKFHMKSDKENKVEKIGVIAQELKEIFPSLVEYDTLADLYTVNYASLSVVALKALQEQQAQIKALSSKLDQLKEDNNDLRLHLQESNSRWDDINQKLQTLLGNKNQK
ncbi:MAG: tail fiber domain-containing protein [Cyclobacteriaceae bacterium]|nr:tail fiber domain-containing protein [Cyclobacteriaceae bacterium]